jgi:hypothetical protein
VAVFIDDLPHLGDHLGRFFIAENSRAGDQDLCAILDEALHVAEAHSSVHLDGDIQFLAFDPVAELPDFLVSGLDKFLASKPRIYRHHKDVIQVFENVVEKMDGSCWVKSETGFLLQLFDQSDLSVKVRGGLDMDGDPVGAGLMEERDEEPGVFDHQMDVKGQGSGLLERRDNLRAQGQVGDKMTVHDIDVDQVGAGLFGHLDRLSDPGKIR